MCVRLGRGALQGCAPAGCKPCSQTDDRSQIKPVVPMTREAPKYAHNREYPSKEVLPGIPPENPRIPNARPSHLSMSFASGTSIRGKPEVWECKFDVATGRYFHVNGDSNTRSWTKPLGTSPSVVALFAYRAPNPGLPDKVGRCVLRIHLRVWMGGKMNSRAHTHTHRPKCAWKHNNTRRARALPQATQPSLPHC